MSGEIGYAKDSPTRNKGNPNKSYPFCKYGCQNRPNQHVERVDIFQAQILELYGTLLALLIMRQYLQDF